MVYVAYALVFAAPAQHLFDRLCAMLGQPELPRDPRFASAEERPKHLDVVLSLAEQWFAARPLDKAVAELRANDISHSPIMRELRSLRSLRPRVLCRCCHVLQ